MSMTSPSKSSGGTCALDLSMVIGYSEFRRSVGQTRRPASRRRRANQEIMRSKLLITFALLVAVCPHAPRVTAQKVARDARADNFDRAEDEEDLNRELWEYVKGTPYEEAMKYVAASQAQARAAREREEVAELPNGWRIAPAGRQVEVGRLPYEAVPFNGHLVVLNAGYYTREPQELSVVDTATGRVEKTVRLNSIFPSATVGPGGDLYVSGGFDGKVYRLNPQFAVAREYAVAGFAAGLAPLDEHHVAVLYLAAKDEKGNYVAGRLALLNTDDGKIEREADAGYFPYSVRLVNGKLYVAVLGENRLRVFDSRLGPVKELEVGRRPQEMCVDGSRLYVVNTDSDELSVVDTARDAVVGSVRVSRPGSRFGATPTSCAVAGRRIYVTLAGLNAVAVLEKDTWRQIGLVPVGWYPTKVLAGGNELLVLSAKGIRARRPNPNGPQPVAGGGGPDYVLTLLKGSLSIIPAGEVEAKRDAWARQVEAGAPTFDARRGFKLPIRYVFYVIKENRTFDQVLGDLGRGDGDPSLVLFGREVTPNHHALAEQFVMLDNLDAAGEISVLGHSFTTSGYASPCLEWLGNASYSGRYKGYPFGMVPSVTSPAYLWDALDYARVPYRVYGENYYLYTRAYRIITETFGAESTLARKFYARTMRLSSDVDRGRVFYDFAHTCAGRLARLNYLWLPNDHTNGSDTKIRTPQQFVAQNDAALGLIVETISRSSIWSQSLIIVEEDDAQNGPDHVDATRTVALAAGPHVRRGAIVHDRYDQLSALRTIELLLGLDPLNLNDRVAVPMFGVFDPRADAAPYTPTAPSPTLSEADRARYGTLTRAAP